MSKMKFKPYPKYKDSGVEWIGNIPERWEARRLKYVSRFNYGDSLAEENRNDTGEILVYGSNGVVGQHDIAITSGETIIIGRKGSYGQVNWSSKSCFPIDTTFYIDKNTTRQSLRWIYYLLKVLKLDEGSQDSAVPGLSREKAYSHIVPFPEYKEQKQISTFLDQETSQINATIEKYEKLIELLKEKRIALISHAVTKGLNPDVKMKDSGVEWIGEIPEHWEVKKIGYIANKIGSGKTPKGGSEIYINEGVMLIRSQNVYDEGLVLDDVAYIDNDIDEEMSQTRLKENDLLLNITGASIGRTNTVPANILPANVNQHVCIIRLKNGLYTQYVSYCLKSKIIKHQIFSIENGTSREGLNFPQVKNLVFILPNNIAEQEEIADYLDQETSKIDQLIEKINKQIEQLKEYKTSLISHAVTGKIDVRGIV